jgi:hypothetical protein
MKISKIILLFVLVVFVSAMVVNTGFAAYVGETPGYKVDNGSLKSKIGNNSYLMKWETYYDKQKRQQTVYQQHYTYDRIDKKYNLDLTKVSKNKIRVVEYFYISVIDASPNKSVKYYNTTVNPKSYYFKYYKPIVLHMGWVRL